MAETAILDVNPLREGLRAERVPSPLTLVIFGATGDLTRRKLMPALYNLARARLLPAGFSVVGFARRNWDDERFRSEMRGAVDNFSRTGSAHDAVWEGFAAGIRYVSSTFDDPQGYQRLAGVLRQLDQERGTGDRRLFYLATPPSVYEEIVRQLDRAGLASRGGGGPWARIVVEKPFGRDLASARQLNGQLHQVLSEDQVYRIDHYLGKETVQNILVFRFANGIFEPLWNSHFIDHVQIIAAEDLGIEGRGGYYDETGALRDMVQNHMLQLLALVAMEPPASFDPERVRDEKVKLLRAVRPLRGSAIITDAVRGQYGPGSLSGEEVPGYREEPEVARQSATETFVTLRLFVDNWRWAGVPFYLRTGKRLPRRATEIAVQFRRAPHLLFGSESLETAESNLIALRIQPDEGITLRFGAKVPEPAMEIRSVNMDFRYGGSFGVAPPEAYERLLLDCMLGDATLFTRHDEVETAWALIADTLQAWGETAAADFPNYRAGTWGPQAAHALLERDGREWRRI